MKQAVPMPIVAAALVLVVLVVCFFVWRSYSAPPAVPPSVAAAGPSRAGTVDQKKAMIQKIMQDRQRQGQTGRGPAVR